MEETKITVYIGYKFNINEPEERLYDYLDFLKPKSTISVLNSVYEHLKINQGNREIIKLDINFNKLR